MLFLNPMLTQNDLKKIKTIVDTSTNRLDKKFTKRFNTLEKKLDITTDFLDGEIIDLKKRTDRVEDVLNLPPLSA